jgi:hypothetical protein
MFEGVMLFLLGISFIGGIIFVLLRTNLQFNLLRQSDNISVVHGLLILIWPFTLVWPDDVKRDNELYKTGIKYARATLVFYGLFYLILFLLLTSFD